MGVYGGVSMNGSKTAKSVIVRRLDYDLEKEKIKRKLKDSEKILPVEIPKDIEISIGVKSVGLRIEEKSPEDAVMITEDTTIKFDDNPVEQANEIDESILEDEQIFPKGLQTVKEVIERKMIDEDFILPLPILLKGDNSSGLDLFLNNTERSAKRHRYKVIKKHPADLMGKEKGSIKDSFIELISDISNLKKVLLIIPDIDLLASKRKKNDFARKEFIQGLAQLANLIGEKDESILIMTSEKGRSNEWIEELSLTVKIQKPSEENLIAATEYLSKVYGKLDKEREKRIKQKVQSSEINTYSALKKEYMIQGWESAGIDASAFENKNLRDGEGKPSLYQ